jgi:hypothetical protein
MGRVSIWAQWLIIVSGVLLSPLFVLLMAGVIGRSMLRKPCRRARTLGPPMGQVNIGTNVRLTAPAYPCPPGGDAAPPHLAQGSRYPGMRTIVARA